MHLLRLPELGPDDSAIERRFKHLRFALEFTFRRLTMTVAALLDHILTLECAPGWILTVKDDTGSLRIGGAKWRVSRCAEVLRAPVINPPHPAHRGGFRPYPAGTLARLRFIKQGQIHRLTLREIRERFGFQDRRGREPCAIAHAKAGQCRRSPSAAPGVSARARKLSGSVRTRVGPRG